MPACPRDANLLSMLLYHSGVPNELCLKVTHFGAKESIVLPQTMNDIAKSKHLFLECQQKAHIWVPVKRCQQE